MASVQKKRFEEPDETSTPPRSKVETVRIGGMTLTKITYAPGWKWSTDIRPIVGTNSCQKHHVGFCMAGRLEGKLDDGTKWELAAGDVFDIPPGHDGWVVGSEPVVLLQMDNPAISK
jgi:hypothetical protein